MEKVRSEREGLFDILFDNVVLGISHSGGGGIRDKMDIITSQRYTEFNAVISGFGKLEKEARKEADTIMKRIFKNGVQTVGWSLLHASIDLNADSLVYNTVNSSEHDHKTCVQYELGTCTKPDCMCKCSDSQGNIVTYPVKLNTNIIEAYTELVVRIIITKLPKYMIRLQHMLEDLRLIVVIQCEGEMVPGSTYAAGKYLEKTYCMESDAVFLHIKLIIELLEVLDKIYDAMDNDTMLLGVEFKRSKKLPEGMIARDAEDEASSN